MKRRNICWGAFASGCLGLTYGDMGDYEKAEEYHKKYILITEDARVSPSWLNVHKLYLAKVMILNHQSAVDLHKLNSLIITHEKNRLAVCESFGARCIGEIYLHIDDHHMAEAEAWIKRVIEANTGYAPSGIWPVIMPSTPTGSKRRETFKAKEQLTKAIDLFRECGAERTGDTDGKSPR